MGKRSSTGTLIGIIQSFLRQRTWTQAELARELGLQVPALRRQLSELQLNGFPFEVQTEPPQVYWSLPSDWLPGAVEFTLRDTTELLRLLNRLPRSADVERFIRRIGRNARQPALAEAVHVEPREPREEEMLKRVEDSIAERRALRFHYYSLYRGSLEWRSASVQRVLVEQPARFVGYCHRTQQLKWFRVDRMLDAILVDSEHYRDHRREANEFVTTSMDGYRAAGDPIRVVFTVFPPNSRWVKSNLPAPLRVASESGEELRVEGQVAGLLPVARFVVGLGGSACAETPELAGLVRGLAEGALAANLPQTSRRSARPIAE